MARRIKVKRSEPIESPPEPSEPTPSATATKPRRSVTVKKSASKTTRPQKYNASLEKKIKVDPFIKKDVKCKKCKRVKKGALVSQQTGVCVECIIKGG